MKRVLILATALSLVSCGGGGGAPAVPAPKASGGSAHLGVTLVIPKPVATAGRAHRAYVSAGTQGAKIVVTGAGGASFTTVVDLSPGSGSCTTGSPRTCNFNVSAPVDTDTFVITLYDQAPVGGVIPAGANVLGTQTVMQNIAGPSTPTLTLYVSAVVHGFGGSIPAATSLAADGSAHSFALLLVPVDAANQPVTGGSNDPYANPITVTLSELGGSGHAHLVLNGANAGTTATVSHNTDSLTMAYDGGGLPGYYDTLTIAATGVVSQTVRISPLYVTSGSSYVSGRNVRLTGATNPVPLSITEANAASAAYTATPGGGCSNVVTASITGSGASAALSLAGGTTPTSTGCSVAIGDGTSSINLVVTNTLINGYVPLAPNTINEFNMGTVPSTGGQFAPNLAAVGHNGDMWFGSNSISGAYDVALNGTLQTLWTYSTSSTTTALIAGPEGYIWWADSGFNVLTTGSANPAAPTLLAALPSQPTAMAIGSDANVYYADTSAMVNGLTITGGDVLPAAHPLVYPGVDSSAMTTGPDGNLWLPQPAENNVAIITPGSASESDVTLPGGSHPTGVVRGTNNVWVSLAGSNSIASISASPPYTVTPYTVGATSPGAMTMGPDGNLWFCTGGTQIATFNVTTHATSTFPGISGACTSIVTGPDGYLWFAEPASNFIGKLSP